MSNSFIIILMNELNQLIQNFEQYKISHPNISNVWILFLTYKLNKINNIISQANFVLNKLTNTNDFTIDQIYLLTNI